MEEDKYFIVTAKCGHVGKNKYIEKNLTIIAISKKEAAEKGRAYPRVKHNWKDAIIDVVEVDEDEYWKFRVENYNDPYFSVRNIQEQRYYCDQIHKEVIEVERKEHSKIERRRRINYLMKKRAIEEKFSVSY